MTVLVFVGSLLALMALGMPVAFSLIGCGIVMMYYMGLTDPQIVIQNMWDGANSFPLLAVPFFMLAGEFMNAGGMTRRIITMAMAWVGHIRGGLGYVAVMAAIVMASLSGSAVADTAALATVLVPLMRNAGYDINRSCGLIACGGIIAPVIPPSIGFILFGVTGGVSITKLFIAGIVPGIMMGVAIMIAWHWCTKRDVMKVEPKLSMKARWQETRDAVWALVLPVVITVLTSSLRIVSPLSMTRRSLLRICAAVSASKNRSSPKPTMPAMSSGRSSVPPSSFRTRSSCPGGRRAATSPLASPARGWPAPTGSRGRARCWSRWVSVTARPAFIRISCPAA